MKKFLKNDQIRFLKTKTGSQKCHKWSMETIKNCLKIRFWIKFSFKLNITLQITLHHLMIFRLATGMNGYNLLKKEGYPIPAYRTLCKKTNEINFVPGILSNVLMLLKDEVSTNNKETNVTLVLDEMKIKENISYDKSKFTLLIKKTQWIN